MIIVNPIGGLANRMRAMASGAALASFTGEEVRFVWGINDELGASYDELFDRKGLPGELINISSGEQLWLWDKARKKNLGLSRLFWTLRFRRARRYDHHPFPEDLLAMVEKTKGDIMLQSGLNIFPFQPEMYRRIFIPSNSVLSDADRIADRFSSNTIGCHIRRTDNAESIARSPLWLFTKRMEEALRKDPDTKFYVASDDISTKDELRIRFGHAVITSDLPLERRSAEGMKAALVELLLLSRTSEIWGSYYSTYSEAASILGDIPLTQLSNSIIR